MTNKRIVKRFFTTSKEKAFSFMQEKNKVRGKNVWRVAAKIKDRIIFDLDSFDVDNASRVLDYYRDVFGYDFRVIKTYSGYHLISKKKYDDILQWQYDTCRVLYPFLQKEHLQRYIEMVQKFYKDERKKQQIDGLNRTEFIDYLPQKFMDSGLFCGIGNFDMLFAINVIMKGYYCLRISKKDIDDNPIEINL